jgi:hypothetical protein
MIGSLADIVARWKYSGRSIEEGFAAVGDEMCFMFGLRYTAM